MRHRSATMDTLVAVGTGIAFLYSTCSLVAGIVNFEYEPNLVYDTATMVWRRVRLDAVAWRQ